MRPTAAQLKEAHANAANGVAATPDMVKALVEEIWRISMAKAAMEVAVVRAAAEIEELANG